MAIPSSPPVPELDLPSSPASIQQDDSQTSLRGRKRPLSEYGSLSSDPLFSEDVSDVDLQDEGPRRKRLVKGPWWTLKHRRGHGGFASSGRALQSTDSGVFMGSDDSIDSAEIKLPSTSQATRIADADHPFSQICSTPKDSSEERAKAVVTQALEDGNEVIDLANLELEHLKDEVLQPLHQLIRRPQLDENHLPSEDDYTPLTPSIQVYLSNNKLTSLPAELFKFSNITVLSLRNNKITHLPHYIKRLTALKELNLAGNELQYLPWEIMRMLEETLSSELVVLQPNKFNLEQMHIIDENVSIARSLDVEAGDHLMAEIVKRVLANFKFLSNGFTIKEKSLSIFLGASNMVHYDVTGRPLTYPRIEDAIKRPKHERGVLSLYETALYKIRSQRLSRQALDLCAGAPMTVRDNLAKAIVAEELGNEVCSSCWRGVLTPRATWIEYWWHGDRGADFRIENVYPLMRKACTPECAMITRPGTFKYP